MRARGKCLLAAALGLTTLSCGRSDRTASTGSAPAAPTPGIRVCAAAELPKDKWPEAQRKAIAENPANDVSGKADGKNKAATPAGFDPLQTVPKGIFSSGRKWQNGKILRVRFDDSESRIVEEKVRRHAVAWEQFANLTFRFLAADAPAEVRGGAEIRIAFVPGEAWSKIGTDALTVPPNEPTMSLGLVTRTSDEEKDRSVILHEFGHAIGLIHEHNHPQGGISWNREQVYADMAAQRPPWPREKVDFDIFNVYKEIDRVFTPFDTRSVMMYAIPAEWTTDGFKVGWNTELSNDDKEFIAAQYPKPRK